MDTNLKRIRENAGISQLKLAELSGVSVRMIQKYEQRDRDINKAQVINICKIASALGCNVQDLIETE